MGHGSRMILGHRPGRWWSHYSLNSSSLHWPVGYRPPGAFRRIGDVNFSLILFFSKFIQSFFPPLLHIWMTTTIMAVMILIFRPSRPLLCLVVNDLDVGQRGGFGGPGCCTGQGCGHDRRCEQGQWFRCGHRHRRGGHEGNDGWWQAPPPHCEQ